MPGQEHIAQSYPGLRWPLLQRYMSPARHRVYSVSGIKDADGGVLSACVSYKREQWPPVVGVSTLQVGCEDQRILDRGLQIVNQILSCGIFEIELLSDGNDLFPIDLNPRAFGFLELDIARGSDLPWLWYRSTLEPLVPAPNQILRASLAARSSLFPMGSLKHDAGMPRSSVLMLGHWTDPLPMIVSHLYSLRHPRAVMREKLAGWRVAAVSRM
jgi:hypothetical protein